MAKIKKGDVLVNGNIPLPEELQPIQKPFRVIEAFVKDGFCHHVYMYLSGVEKGNKQKSNSIYIVKEELRNAFAMFNAHMACIDDLFKQGGVEVDDIDMLHSHPFTFLMECTGFKIYGEDDNEKISLIGTKHLSGNMTSDLTLPKIPLDNLSSYKWYNELKSAADEARRQVQAYHFGNYTVPEDHEDDEEDEKAKKKQTKMQFAKSEGQEEEPVTIDDDPFEEDFGGAKI